MNTTQRKLHEKESFDFQVWIPISTLLVSWKAIVILPFKVDSL